MNKKLILIPSVTVVLFLIWAVFSYMPLSKQGSQLKHKIEVLEKREKAKISEQELMSVNTLVDSLEARLKRGKKRFYPAENLLDLGREIERIVKKYDISLVSITPNYPSLAIFKDSQSSVVELPLAIQLQGRFTDFTKFLDDIPHLPFILRVNEVTLKVEEKSASRITIVFQGVIVLDKERKNSEKEAEKNIEKRA
ncbi:type 4a pilus biogenesis protein PilO [bacterium]|nr:type 4a pilus biogenesis protein PilO [bacterium]